MRDPSFAKAVKAKGMLLLKSIDSLNILNTQIVNCVIIILANQLQKKNIVHSVRALNCLNINAILAISTALKMSKKDYCLTFHPVLGTGRSLECRVKETSRSTANLVISSSR